MAKYFHDFDQTSEIWEQHRLGIPTASEFKKIITPEGKASTQWKAYTHRLIAEKILKRQVDFAIAGSAWMQRGKELESEAVLDYELQTDTDTTTVGFVTTDDGLFGCSPDRLVGEDGLLELKCPAPQTQIEYLITGEEDKDYKPQLQGQLYVTGRQWVDIYAYHPELPRIALRVYRDEVYLKILESLLNKVNDYITDNIIKIAERMHEIRPTEKTIEQIRKERELIA